MFHVTINGNLRCEVLGYSSPVTYRFHLRPRYPIAPDSVWDEIALLDVTRLIGPSSGAPIEYPIHWEFITDTQGFGRMLSQAVEELRRTGRLDPPPGISEQELQQLRSEELIQRMRELTT